MTDGYVASFQVAGVDDLTCAEVFSFTFPTLSSRRPAAKGSCGGLPT